MKRLRKLLLFLAAVQVVNTVSGIVIKSRFLSQQLGEGEVNAVGVSGRESHVNKFQRRIPEGCYGWSRNWI